MKQHSKSISWINITQIDVTNRAEKLNFRLSENHNNNKRTAQKKKITHQFNNALKRATFWFGDRWSNFVFFSRLFSTFFTLSTNENPFVHFVLSFIVNVVRVQNPYTIYNIFDILSSFFLSAKRIIFWARVIYLPASIHILWFCVIPIPVLDIISFGDIYTQYTAQYTHR